MAIGAILGLAGSLATNVISIFRQREERKMRQLELEHETRRWGHEKDMFKLQSQAKVAETEQEAFLMTVQGSYDGLRASIADQTALAAKSSPWVANILTLFRPAMTLSFIALVVYLSIWANDTNVRSPAILAGIDLALMSSTWWFGDRSTKRVAEAMRGDHIRGAGGAF
ncbi:MAG: hypothetical protein ACPGVT_07930 [Maricaulaceae bacterium]